MTTYIPHPSSYTPNQPHRFDAFSNKTCHNSINSKNAPRATTITFDTRDWRIVLLLQSHYKTCLQVLASAQQMNYTPARTMHQSTFQSTKQAPHSWSWQENLFHSRCARQCFSSRRWCIKKCTKCYTHKLKRCISLVGFIHVTDPMLPGQDIFLFSSLKLLKQANANVTLDVTGFLCIEHRIVTDSPRFVRILKPVRIFCQVTQYFIWPFKVGYIWEYCKTP